MTDSRELAAPVRQSENLLAQVIAAAKDPQVDAAKMETLARLVNSQQDRERENEFNRDLNAAIMSMPTVTKSGEIIIPANQAKGTPERKQGKFARFEDIDRVCRPILARHNLAIRFEVGNEESAVTVRPIISHANGYTSRGEAMRVPADTSGSKNAAQAVGSSVQYAKRYSYCAALNIQTEGVDDDGNQGRLLRVTLPFEREQLVRQEAEAAANAGRYVEWFSQQSPKDRAWLVNQKFHVDFGGQPLLTSRADAPGSQRREEERPAAPSTSPAREPDQAAPPPPPPPPASSEQTGGQAKRTPVQMVEDFEKRLGEVKEARGITDLQAEPKILQWMGSLEERYPDLHQRVVDYAASKYAALSAAEKDKARSGETLV